jgi:hypothetical protein
MGLDVIAGLKKINLTNLCFLGWLSAYGNQKNIKTF